MENEASDTPSKETVDPPIPSCESCRKRKLKCTRQQPVCLNCEKFDVECIYDYDRKKPGLKVGAVESLSRRLDTVEKALSSIQQDQRNVSARSATDPLADLPSFADPQQAPPSQVIGVLSALTKELHNLSAAVSSSNRVPQHVLALDDGFIQGSPRKRHRSECREHGESHTSLGDTPRTFASQYNPLSHSYIENNIDNIIDAYFRFIHPWISILHEPSFREDARSPKEKERLRPVILAVAIAVLRFTQDKEQIIPHDFLIEQMAKARQSLLSIATADVCTTNMQALLILAYTDILDDKPHSAFSLLGMITSNIRYLQLHLEPPGHEEFCGIFGKPGTLVAPAEWMEEEERRRLFWNAFMLDRLCSAMLECLPSMSGADINRRLPTCASFWFTNQRHLTPYLRISHSPAASLGRSEPLQQALNETGLPDDTTGSANIEASSLTGIGSLAFYVQTVASMSMVISQFVHRTVDFDNRNDVSRWLTSFRELDLHLIRWKRDLPQQWVDSGVSRVILPGVMDPAMTAANATHNTCLILLHEKIAYPDAKLTWIQLPSIYSAKTCQNAAIEVCTIVTKFLQQRRPPYPISPQLGLCTFVTARSLLLHWRYYGTPLAPEFWLLVRSLDDMSSRWKWRPETQSPSCFSRFAHRLRTIHARCEINPSYRIEEAEWLYERNFGDARVSARRWVYRDTLKAYLEKNCVGIDPISLENAGPATVVSQDGTNSLLQESNNAIAQHGQAFDAQQTLRWNTMAGVGPSETSIDDDNLLQLSQALMDPGFTAIDRIVSFDDMMLNGYSEAPVDWNLG